MRTDKEVAFTLRRNGKSYSQIRRELKIPLATLSDWFSTVSWSKNIKSRLIASSNARSSIRIRELNKIRGSHLYQAYQEAREEAKMEFEELKYNPVFISGLMLYWGEGDKRTRAQVKLANTDPNMIRLYAFFLRKICRIPEDRIRAYILIYPDLDEESCLDHWSFHSGIEKNKFFKCITIQGKQKGRKLAYGVCSITVTSTYFKEKMLLWLQLLPNELMNESYYANI